MKKLFIVAIVLFLASSSAFCDEISEKQMKKLEKIEIKKVNELENAYVKINRLKWNKNTTHDQLNAYSQKLLSRIYNRYEKRISKIIDKEQLEAYKISIQ